MIENQVVKVKKGPYHEQKFERVLRPEYHSAHVGSQGKRGRSVNVRTEGTSKTESPEKISFQGFADFAPRDLKLRLARRT